MSASNIGLLDQFEIGGTFFELIEFSLERHLPDGRRLRGIYGVNVAKVREVVHMPKINPLASRIPGVSGIFELRGVPIPAINLCHILGDHTSDMASGQQIIVTEFSAKRAGFMVSTTHRIRRVSWEKVMPPSSDSDSCMSGMILIEDNNFLFILDLEKILNTIELKHGETTKFSPYQNNSNPDSLSLGSDRNSLKSVHSERQDKNKPGILFVDDSKLILNNVGSALAEKGYRVLTASNGAEALELLNAVYQGEYSHFGSVHCLITDVEMPLMDGLTLVKRLRSEPKFEGLPILLHTSLSGDVTQTAAQTVGADGYVVKNDVRELFEIVGNILKERKYSLGG